jgi:hypothetical protein
MILIQECGCEGTVPVLALYPTAKVLTDVSDTAKKLKTTDALVPDGENYLNPTEWDVRHCVKLTMLDTKSGDSRSGNRIVTVDNEPEPNAKDPDLWYDPQLLAPIRMREGYMRMHGYVLAEARTASGKDGV